MKLWEILVPKFWNNGQRIPLRYHRAWDEKVRAVSGGLTILRSVKGQWESPGGKIYKDQMIPVRVACNDRQFRRILEITLEHYVDQEAIMAYLVGAEIIIKRRKSGTTK